MKVWFSKRPSVLVYHHISVSGKARSVSRDSVSLSAFERQMTLLSDRFNVVPIETLLSLLHAGRPLPPKTVVITFDDGYGSTFTRALPVLSARNLPSTVFLATAFIGKGRPFEWLRPGEDGEELPMDWDEVQGACEGGMAIGSHTHRHLFLPMLTESEIERELMRSKTEITSRTGLDVNALALPYSYPITDRRWPSFDAALMKAMRRSAFDSCCTLSRGRPIIRESAFFIPRVPVFGDDSSITFLAKALGVYGYSGALQTLFQRYLKNYGIRGQRANSAKEGHRAAG